MLVAAGALTLGALVLRWPRDVRVVHPYAPIPLTLSLDGRVFARVVQPTATVRLRTRLLRTNAGVLGDVVTRVASPCGEFVIDRSYGLRPFVHDNGLLELEVYPSLWRLWVDNRGQQATSLRFGALDLPVPAGVLQRYEIPVAGCHGPQPLRLGEREIGSVVLAGRSAAGLTSGGVVVDPTGRRCYALGEVAYGARPGFAGQAPPRRLEPTMVHTFEYAPDYVLERAPSRVEELSDRRLPTLTTERSELLEQPCAAPAL